MKNQSLISEKRLVFRNVSSGRRTSAETPDDYTQYDARAVFKGSLEDTISDLAADADPDNAVEYAKKIEDSFRTHLKSGKTLADLENYLNEQKCKYSAISSGMCNFYRGIKDIIDITELFEIRMSAESNIEISLRKKKMAVIKESANKLADLRASIESSNSSLA